MSILADPIQAILEHKRKQFVNVRRNSTRRRFTARSQALLRTRSLSRTGLAKSSGCFTVKLSPALIGRNSAPNSQSLPSICHTPVASDASSRHHTFQNIVVAYTLYTTYCTSVLDLVLGVNMRCATLVVVFDGNASLGVSNLFGCYPPHQDCDLPPQRSRSTQIPASLHRHRPIFADFLYHSEEIPLLKELRIRAQ
ncbi:hypothetical protein CSKR_105820 [Clonorchis sinensis]|uniref:Uncharacterized protein n=1 Tax=Clonorchis sinensis TaxID=79923 RepID=A0A419PI60_CLOSI|nr:hypothetical protein CSKR_105820 [Clonorchis sinensis]